MAEAAIAKFEKKTVDEVEDWLSDKGFGSVVIEDFRKHQMDGEAISTVFGMVHGPDCLKEVVPIFGVRVRLYNAIRTELMCEETNQHQLSPRPVSPTPSMGFSPTGLSPGLTPSSNPAKSSTISLLSGGSVAKSSKACSSKIMRTCKIPNPFPIPTFRKETEERLSEELLIDTDRTYIVRTLATMLQTYVQKPSVDQSLIVSKSLHEKFTWLGDGESVNSWKWSIYGRAQNVNRPTNSKDSGSTPRRQKQSSSKQKHPYPSFEVEDEESTSRNLQHLKDEIARQKPRIEVLKDLMIRTFSYRRQQILQGSSSVKDILEEFPLLKKSNMVTQELGLVLKNPDIRDVFDDNMILYSRNILSYGKNNLVKNSAVQLVVDNYSSDAELSIHSLVMMAFRCLGLLFTTNRTKRADGDIPYLMKIVPNSTPVNECPDKENNQPHIIVLTDDDNDDLMCTGEDTAVRQYFIAVEQTLVLQTANIVAAIFQLFAAHFIFNLEYHPKAKEFFYFLQEKLFRIPGTGKRSPTATSHILEIERYVQREIHMEQD